jgi:hypothetical protein
MILGVNWIINVALSKEKFLQMHAHQVPGGRTFIMATAKAIGQPDALLMDRLSTNSEKEQPLDAYNHFQISQSRVRRPRLARRIRVSGSLLLRPPGAAETQAGPALQSTIDFCPQLVEEKFCPDLELISHVLLRVFDQTK